MKKQIIFISMLLILASLCFAQTDPFEPVNFLLGKWKGAGSGFGNNTSKIKSSFLLTMDGTYIEVINDSRFKPTEKNPKGEHHIDKGFISYDQSRGMIIYRQFNNEGYINQYFLNNKQSNDSLLIFDSEIIENFVPGGKARWTIKKVSEKEIITTFDVSFPNKDYTCFGTNKLKKK